uniref:Putative similar to chymotrypsin-elastase inhibitor ixodidin n=1 Tax=Rhipicephalus pulchellus TaxID=72859 RepID=L7MCI8_RHIPC
MAWSSQIVFALGLTAFVLVLNAGSCDGVDIETIKKSCKNGEVFGCGGSRPGCVENECGKEMRFACTLECGYGCWCSGKLYRRK